MGCVMAKRKPPASPAYDTSAAIIVWPFGAAPPELTAWLDDPSDLDWLALVPSELANDWIGWLESTGFDSCQSPRTHDLPSGHRVVVGGH